MRRSECGRRVAHRNANVHHDLHYSAQSSLILCNVCAGGVTDNTIRGSQFEVKAINHSQSLGTIRRLGAVPAQ